MKFTAEEKEQIKEMMEDGRWDLAKKACGIMVKRMEINVLNAGISSGSREIVLRKARLEGMQEVNRYLDVGIKAELKKEGLDG